MLQVPIFEAGEQAIFTLMPSSYNNFKDGESMLLNFTIKDVIPNQKFSNYWDVNQILFTIELSFESDGTKVQFNQGEFDYSLKNRTAYLEGREIPYT